MPATRPAEIESILYPTPPVDYERAKSSSGRWITEMNRTERAAPNAR